MLNFAPFWHTEWLKPSSGVSVKTPCVPCGLAKLPCLSQETVASDEEWLRHIHVRELSNALLISWVLVAPPAVFTFAFAIPPQLFCKNRTLRFSLPGVPRCPSLLYFVAGLMPSYPRILPWYMARGYPVPPYADPAPRFPRQGPQ